MKLIKIRNYLQHIRCVIFKFVYKRWLIALCDGEINIKIIKIKGWRTALVENKYGVKVAISPCFLQFKQLNIMNKFNIKVALRDKGNCKNQKIDCHKCPIGEIIGMTDDKDELCYCEDVYKIVKKLSKIKFLKNINF